MRYILRLDMQKNKKTLNIYTRILECHEMKLIVFMDHIKVTNDPVTGRKGW